jgi:membrane associated rhomboid family serine protease
MLLPLEDENPITHIAYQYVTMVFVAVCGVVFLWQISLGETDGRKFILGFGAIPSVLFGERDLAPELAMIPASTVPMIGASGAISGVIGAYLTLHQKAQILTLVFRFFIHIPAYVLLGMWIALQVISLSMAAEIDGGGWWAHIGGLIASCILIFPMRHKSVPLFSRPTPIDDASETGPHGPQHGPCGRLTLSQAKNYKQRRSFIPDSGNK